jgi:cyclic pyranopterin phosphate synthase
MAGKDLTHFDEAGRPRMVDVSEKPVTARRASASAMVRMNAAAFAAVISRRTKKGDPLAAAELAGVMGAKKTPDLIPLSHPLPLSAVSVAATPVPAESAVRISASVSTTGQTGAEMEALTAAAVAALTLYDMLKAVDKAILIESLRLDEKSGGASGDYRRTEG